VDFTITFPHDAILNFLATTEVGQIASSPVADEEPGSEASEWEKREREEYLAQVAEGERELEEGRKIRGRWDYRLSFISYFSYRKAEGGRVHLTGTLGRSVVAGKRVL